ncbi:GNAT family N-acetyltransferase [Pseudoduganella violacea]|uniref:Ribosomal protein S18 acetylase RimI-like enzyme n=1 Tax=Pseudoduganella violacea TaxID=1715466 RepID=A0A7W5FU70_9BURK|nr:GNAT family N-acetyltransferase [Pseudoduganella violacea]MBB3119539.1 ribosomal protein S18 acetylase RimI-like enzyme [Pseudoduganella violacea]
MPAIRAAEAADLPVFFDYLNEHLSGNGGNGAPLFQPMARGSIFPDEKRAGFAQGLATALDQPGWRRLWLAEGENGILGHIDLRARPEGAARHRCLLGMGVHEQARRCGLGMALLDVAIAWAGESARLEWVDLEVLGANGPARALYRKRGFVQTGEMPDLFRIDGERLAYIYMSLALSAER